MTNPAVDGRISWWPWSGAFIIGLGILFQIAQLVVSFRGRAARRDLTGEPVGRPHAGVGDGLAAAALQLRDDAGRGTRSMRLTAMKASGAVPRRPAARYFAHPTCRRNTASGLVIGAFSVVLGFALIWHIWWLAVAGLGRDDRQPSSGARSNDDTDYVVPAEQIARDRRPGTFQLLAAQA